MYFFIKMFVAKTACLSVIRVEKPGMATDNSLTGMETLEGFVMGLYLEAFQALVSLINRYTVYVARCVIVIPCHGLRLSRFEIEVRES